MFGPQTAGGGLDVNDLAASSQYGAQDAAFAQMDAAMASAQMGGPSVEDFAAFQQMQGPGVEDFGLPGRARTIAGRLRGLPGNAGAVDGGLCCLPGNAGAECRGFRPSRPCRDRKRG